MGHHRLASNLRQFIFWMKFKECLLGTACSNKKSYDAMIVFSNKIAEKTEIAKRGSFWKEMECKDSRE